LLTQRQTDKLWQKHKLLGGGNNVDLLFCSDANAVAAVQ